MRFHRIYEDGKRNLIEVSTNFSSEVGRPTVVSVLRLYIILDIIILF